MKLNRPLVIGGIILVLLLVVVMMPGFLADKNPYSIMTLKYSFETVDGETTFDQAPFEPSDNFRWGTDELGRDIFSFVIYGTRLTLKIALLVTLFRFILALPLGLLAGFNYSLPKSIIRQVNILFSGLPPLLFAIFVLYLNIFSRLDKTWSTIAFITVLTVVGFGKLAIAFEDSTKLILSKPYIRSEYLLGKSKYEVAIENVIPHLMPEVVILFFMEIARVLTLQIQLGLFAIFIGNLKILLSDDFGVIRYWDVSFEPEWASLLGYAADALRVAPWMVIYPTLAFFVSVLGFNMFGEGLRIILQDPKSDFIPKVRKAISKVFIRKHRHESFNYRRLLFYVMALVLIVFVFNLNSSTHELEEIVYIDRQDLPKRLYVGMEEIDQVTTYLSEKMASIGMEPLYEDYKQTYETDQTYYVDQSYLSIDDKVYEQDIDYVVHGFDSYQVEANIIDARNYSLYNEAYYPMFAEKVIWIDGSYYTPEAIEIFSSKLADTGCKGLIVSNHSWKTSKGSFKGSIPIVGVSDKVDVGGQLSYESSAFMMSSKGVNVIGMVKGHDINTSQEVLVIGLPLNYRDVEDGYFTYNYGLELIDKLKDETNRTMVLAFFDGNYDQHAHGVLPFSTGMKFDPFMHTMYFNIRDVHYGGDKVYINRDMSPLTRYFGISFFQSIEQTEMQFEVMTEKEPDDLNTLIKHPDYVMHHKKGIDTLILDVYTDPEVFFESFYYALKENN
ncbi:ABC transporter permease subunit [Acidaminobacter sp. JC074]|uniref:ABC transporter permease n=1 Tax=Acidaminobacter sp. JC074 TaxID=2530199 RepID=UPI001F10AFA6|nr:ABC transporter permease subunit [Acidaminobacter sp. JC074]MCH4886108.1 ABC transporter permease subunit [Acidaminobacter sp. JC074]